MSMLVTKHCVPCERGTPTLSPDEARTLLGQLPEWTIGEDGRSVSRTFRFEDFYETIAFVNAVAWLAHREDHHPDLQVGYRTCLVRYTTHAAGGLTENDMISAAKVDALLGA